MTNHNPNRAPLADLIVLTAFILGVFCIAFVAGVAALHYNVWPAFNIREGFEAGEAWMERRAESRSMPSASIESVNLKDAMVHATIETDPARAYNGYTLLNLRYSKTPYLIDMQGHVKHQWNLPFYKVWPHPRHIAHPVPEEQIYINSAQVLADGSLIAVYIGEGDTPYGYGIAKVDKDSRVLWTYDDYANHECYIDRENGDIYGLVHHVIKKPSASQPETLAYPLLADDIVTLSPGGKEKARISVIDAFLGTPFEAMLYYNPQKWQKDAWDFLHTNSVAKLEPSMAAKFPMFKAGQLLISIRNMSTLAVIDPHTGKVVWAYRGIWDGEHSAAFLPNGHLLLLDNNGQIVHSVTFSRVVEFDPATLGVPWYYEGSDSRPFHTNEFGEVQHLPNDDILVADTLDSRVFEVTHDKKIVWDYRLPGAEDTDKNATRRYETAIISARRYSAQALPFMKGSAP